MVPFLHFLFSFILFVVLIWVSTFTLIVKERLGSTRVGRLLQTRPNKNVAIPIPIPI